MTVNMTRRQLLLIIVIACVGATQGQNVRTFPPGFSFGVATSAYQIEGGWNASGKGESIWDRFVHTRSDMIEDHSTGDIACDSINHVKTDVKMIKDLGVDFYRFSIAWTRILPNGFSNEINQKGVDYYNSLIDELIENNITPIVTIYHWDLPQRFQDLGGWTNEVMVEYFKDYAEVLFRLFGDRVKTWLSFNEPKEICYYGYGEDSFAPALKYQGVAEYLCVHTFLKSHAEVYHLYHEKFNQDRTGRLGITFSASWYEPFSNNTNDIEAAERLTQFTLGMYANAIFNGDYPDVMKERISSRSKEQGFKTSRLPSFTEEEKSRIKGTCDFFGLNHYTTHLVKHLDYPTGFNIPSLSDDVGAKTHQPVDWPQGASSWLKVVPWGFRKMLNWISDNYGSPEIIVFENGFSDKGGVEDENRVNYYKTYMNAMLDAIDDGSNITGYTAWSLMDNFEWRNGYMEKFGIYHVDFEDPGRKRTMKSSAKFYCSVVTTRLLEAVEPAV